MIKRSAQIFSYFFHPLLMPTIGIILLIVTDLNYLQYSSKVQLVILSLIGTLILPSLILPTFYFQGRVSDFKLDKRNERILPMIITIFFFLLTYILFRRIRMVNFLHAFLLGCLLCIAIATLVSTKWKISTHMIGLGGLTGLVLMLSFRLNLNLQFTLIGVLLASGLTGSSRIYLNAHDGYQVVWGYFTGIMIMITTLFFYLY